MKYKYMILGGTGHIGTALSNILLKEHQPTLVIGHNPGKSADWTAKGADFIAVDVMDTKKLSALFVQAERLFILNPPASPDSDTDVIEWQQINSIIPALKDSRPQKIVAASTYGAQKNEHLYDLGVLHDLEQKLKQLDIPLAILRSAYYMSNFNQAVPGAVETGKLLTVFPIDLKLPMIAPEDIAEFAAQLMTDVQAGLFFAEGPEHYSNSDAARNIEELTGKPVKAVNIPESGWRDFMMQGGFSAKTAESFCNMIQLTIRKPFKPESAYKGKTTLKAYLHRKLEA